VSTGCSDSCGALADDPVAAGWTFLAFSSRWRCGPCAAALRKVVGIVGPPGSTPDNLPADSRGAIPKATAESIVAVAVKGHGQ
jgi:hypothetical protein